MSLYKKKALTALEAERSVLGIFLFPGKAVTGLEVERSVLKISYSQERR